MFTLIVTGFAFVVVGALLVLAGRPIGIFDAMIEALGYTVARLVLPLVSFGRVHVQPLNSAQKSFNVLGYRSDGTGHIEIEETIAGFIGFVIFLIGFFALTLLMQAFV
ncbi:MULTISPECIES: hypothetical protein [unclassified Bradyrhizobium]|uniref:hypothetical protein n=1 Tax=unclassified Bradyrhizobium TaxID=2631580 RepID=UPI0028EFE834|nr:MULTISPECIES: hypothetical protein [unclassified Bradyrhizobium]